MGLKLCRGRQTSLQRLPVPGASASQCPGGGGSAGRAGTSQSGTEAEHYRSRSASCVRTDTEKETSKEVVAAEGKR